MRPGGVSPHSTLLPTVGPGAFRLRERGPGLVRRARVGERSVDGQFPVGGQCVELVDPQRPAGWRRAARDYVSGVVERGKLSGGNRGKRPCPLGKRNGNTLTAGHAEVGRANLREPNEISRERAGGWRPSRCGDHVLAFLRGCFAIPGALADIRGRDSSYRLRIARPSSVTRSPTCEPRMPRPRRPAHSGARTRRP